MEYLLKVSPKGQVILPKKLRDSLKVGELVSIEVKDGTGIVKKAELSSGQLAGCFKKYADRKKTSVEKAIEKAKEAVARETAGKAR
ncbi:MAG: AbrB/MazE/SpoVT family DNA-binding domain-containing protein [Nitrospiraceae bacterium]|nr:AbrB/MazE/SpoVT family DNA-binding domain-containing protein [Nitrospiraceae bacterium]